MQPLPITPLPEGDCVKVENPIITQNSDCFSYRTKMSWKDSGFAGWNTCGME